MRLRDLEVVFGVLGEEMKNELLGKDELSISVGGVDFTASKIAEMIRSHTQQNKKAAEILRAQMIELDRVKAQLAEANKKLSWYQSGEIHTCHADCQRPFCVLHRQLESARGVIEFYGDYEDTRIVKMGDNFEHRYNPHIGKKAREALSAIGMGE